MAENRGESADTEKQTLITEIVNDLKTVGHDDAQQIRSLVRTLLARPKAGRIVPMARRRIFGRACAKE